jgi:hypothetical protein
MVRKSNVADDKHGDKISAPRPVLSKRHFMKFARTTDGLYAVLSHVAARTVVL